ncbi:ABC-F family ATP-binding cassette domain-containing protein [Halanaerobiaceae bacterium Z-7014]|uniref:ABC-F family ATP-binding cassette domain-containing protein n=1 Tax=Halonatronomonas betaini TaxID=2778430 RepID=A0A931AVB3_9FIRM|nr:ABC-F family ATP-binding cassette domain-containing protein [Halonatronomonas betaini]
MNFRIYKDSKIALLGANGTGKSILLKIILGEINKNSGLIKRSGQLKIGYFSQKLENLDPNKSLLDELKSKNPDKDEEIIRTFLGSMLFEGKEVFKQIKDLSTGEKVRAAFSNLLLGKFNLLLLDEPLNHLDINSRQIIEEALNNYNGAFLAVSHNRYFIKKVASEIWHLDQGGLEIFKGSYDEYEKYRGGNVNNQKNLDEIVIKMKRAELLSKLEDAGPQEKEELIIKLNNLNK